MGTFVKRDSFRTQKMALLVLKDPTIQSRHGGKGSSDNDKDDDDYEYCANTVCCAIKLSAVLSFPSRPEWLPLSPTAPQFPSPHLPNWTTAQLPSITLSTFRSRLDLQLLHFLDRLPNPTHPQEENFKDNRETCVCACPLQPINFRSMRILCVLPPRFMVTVHTVIIKITQ